MDAPTYGLIGRGLVAAHLGRYLELEGLRHISWHRGMDGDAESMLAEADVILLAISDDAVTGFPADHPGLRDRPMVHFSGSLAVDGITGLHPLMTFGPELYDLETYQSIPFIAERGRPGFRDLFPSLGNPSLAIDSERKPLYHALCVLAGNFTTILWSKAMRDFEDRLNLPREVLRPYLERTAANTLQRGSDALTGSLARGECGTIERDLEGLAGDPFRGVYLAVANAVAGGEVQS
jgi:predicted short-subunit dehydrogenase-like oxidoreductase (DUF2520 family)